MYSNYAKDIEMFTKKVQMGIQQRGKGGGSKAEANREGENN